MLTLAYPRPEEGQSIWSKRQQGFQPCFEAGIQELPFLMPEPAEKPSLHSYTVVSACPQELVFTFKLYLGDTQTECVGSALYHYATLMHCFILVLGLDFGLILYAVCIY